MANRRYGWLPDLPDSRDLAYKTVLPKVKLPEKVDLSPFCSPVEDQGRLGSCTANACAGNLELLECKGINPVPQASPAISWIDRFKAMFGVPPKANPLLANQYKDVSRLFIYYNARKLIGTENQDSGAFIRDCMKTLAREGHCLEVLWPYNTDRFTERPSFRAYQDASKHTIMVYMRLLSLNEILTCLADGYPVIVGITIYESFESDNVKNTGIVDMPKPGERTLGGHAVMIVGYDQATQRFLVRNSWGSSWGMNGYFTIPYDYVMGLGDDFWTIRRGN